MFTPEPRPEAPPREVWPYPKRGLSRVLLRTPLMLYRLGLGEVLARSRLVVLTTIGRKSGLPRHTTVEYRMHGNRVYLISGWGQRTNWVRNLLANPCVTVQAGPRTYIADAHLVEDTGEILRAMLLFRRPAPAIYDALLAKITNAESIDARSLPHLAEQLTVIRLDITEDSEYNNHPPGLKTDLMWVWGAAAFVLMLGATTAFIVNRNQNRPT